jgi:Bacterial Ig-like domain
VVGGAIAVLVTGLLVGLPAKQVAGNAPASFSPLAPQGNVVGSQDKLPLDVPIQVQFTKPMNQGTVEGAFTISPDVKVTYLWDATGQLLSIKPRSHWEPYTTYNLDISPAASDQEGLGLAAAVHVAFDSGAATSGTIVATQVVDGLASPATAFQLTFTRPVKLATVLTRYGISPVVPADITGDDPTDAASQVFTMTPKSSLDASKTYVLTMDVGTGTTAATDAAEAPLQKVPPLTIKTMTAPTVLRFRPQDGVSYDTNQPVSVRFTMAMDRKSTAAAFSVTVNGRIVSGTLGWSEGDTVLVLRPRYAFKIGSTVVARVGPGARSVGGLRLGGAASSTFKISTPRQRSIVYTGGLGAAAAKWYSAEVYYLQLMNCTRSGGWVTSSGECSTDSHHTLPPPGNLLSLNADISNRVSRPYAKYMADNIALDHYLRGTSPKSRLCAAGYCGSSWGENIASPTSVGQAGMIKIELFYQGEYWQRCPNHYCNIMNRYFRQAGIGVWFSRSIRVSIDFYS